MPKELLLELRKRIPFLKKIPNCIYLNLDTSEFLLPDDEISAAREELEKELGHFVMTYKRDALNLKIPVKRHLCVNIKQAELTKEQLRILAEYERKYREKGVNFVVYENPLKLIKQEESAMYWLYKKKGLIK